MKKLLLLLVVLFLVAGSANAAMVLHYEMDSADDFAVGTGSGQPDQGWNGRLYVDNKVTGATYAAMTSTAGIVYDATEGAVYMDGVHPCKIAGAEDAAAVIGISTQYTFSLWAKGDKSAVSGGGYSFYLKTSSGNFKCDLSWNPANAATFTSPGGGWQSSAYGIWDPANTSKYVDPETWNMYTFVWDTDNSFVGTYVNGILRASMVGGTALAAGATITEYGFGDGFGWAGPGGWYKDYKVFDEALDADAVLALVPEPATIALLGFGALALIRKRK